MINSYIHPGSTIGVMVDLEMERDPSSHIEEIKDVAKDICMQIAVHSPLAIEQEQLDSAVVVKEREIAMEQLKSSGKPAHVIEKIIEGKLKKF